MLYDSTVSITTAANQGKDTSTLELSTQSQLLEISTSVLTTELHSQSIDDGNLIELVDTTTIATTTHAFNEYIISTSFATTAGTTTPTGLQATFIFYLRH